MRLRKLQFFKAVESVRAVTGGLGVKGLNGFCKCHLITVITHLLGCKPFLVISQCLTSSGCLV